MQQALGLIYDLASTYRKILQLQKLLESNRAQVSELENHKRDVEAFFEAGTAPRLDLLKTEVELAHARDGVIAVKNSVEAAFSLLRSLWVWMTQARPFPSRISPSPGRLTLGPRSPRSALAKRPDFRAIARGKRIAKTG